MKAAPLWAQDLTINTILYLRNKGYIVELPSLIWRRTHYRTSSGCRYMQEIRINAGYDRLDAKLLILHELAHWASPYHKKTKRFHTAKFWDLAWDLFRWQKLPVKYCLKREGDYMQGAVAAYQRRNRQ